MAQNAQKISDILIYINILCFLYTMIYVD